MEEFWSTQADKLLKLGAMLLSPGAVLSLPALAVSLAIAVGYLALRGKARRGRVRARVIWRALRTSTGRLRHGSVGADVFYFFVNSLAISGLIGWALFSSTVIALHVMRGLGGIAPHRPPALPGWALRGALTLITFLAYEFAYYCDHYAKHRLPFLWAFHQTHHSAEVLTPLTVFRVHPLDTLVFLNIIALFTGIAYGVFLWGAGSAPEPYLICSANALSVVFLLLVSQLQHSQFWLPFRGLAGRLLLSPAHHQLHHSRNPEHFNCNFGSCVALFDWAFGTLHIPPREPPRLAFGVEQPSATPHRISALLLAPFANALRLSALGPILRKFFGAAPFFQKRGGITNRVV